MVEKSATNFADSSKKSLKLAANELSMQFKVSARSGHHSVCVCVCVCACVCGERAPSKKSMFKLVVILR
jgi:hypothetical protein